MKTLCVFLLLLTFSATLQQQTAEQETADYAPVKVVSVDERANALKDGEVIINKIDYVDGSVWKKRGWNYKLPADSTQKLSDGQCSVF
jgi:hypothetical protein